MCFLTYIGKFADANPILHQTGPMIENWVQQNRHQKENVAKQQKEYLQIFFLVLQVCNQQVLYIFSEINSVVFLKISR